MVFHEKQRHGQRMTADFISGRQDLKMFGAALSACDRGKQWPVALAVLEQMEEEEVAPGQIACNSLVPRRPRWKPGV